MNTRELALDRLEARALTLVRAGETVRLSGHDRLGWDTEDVHTEEQVRAYFSHQRAQGTGEVRLLRAIWTEEAGV